jgi:hypothetical protein
MVRAGVDTAILANIIFITLLITKEAEEVAMFAT